MTRLFTSSSAQFIRLVSVLSLVVGLGLGLVVVHLFVATIVRVDGASMESTLPRAAWVVVSKLSRTTVKRGQIIGVELPHGPRIIKRVIGLPGEHLRITKGQVLINGQVSIEPYAPLPTDGELDRVLTSNQYLLLGDNRSDSVDSRHFGPIEEAAIIGRVTVLFWPTFRIF